jgi:hypothetical protein
VWAGSGKWWSSTCREPTHTSSRSENVTVGGAGVRSPHSTGPNTASSPPIRVAATSSRVTWWPMIVAPSATSELPWVWSPWWWVFTSVRTGSGVTASMAERKPRVRRSVEHVSTATTRAASRSTRKPVLLIHHDPSGWT